MQKTKAEESRTAQNRGEKKTKLKLAPLSCQTCRQWRHPLNVMKFATKDLTGPTELQAGEGWGMGKGSRLRAAWYKK